MSIPVALAVVKHNACYLVGPRGKQGVLPGYWEFPGGKTLPGESAEETVVRECLEETGLHVRARCLRYRTTHHYDYGVVDLSFLDCELLDEREAREPRPPFRWVAAAELGDYPFPPANDEVLRQLIDEASQNPV